MTSRNIAERLARDPVTLVVLRGANAERIEAALAASAPDQPRCRVESLGEAVAAAVESLSARGGSVLLSPGAPSFGEFRDYADRGQRFQEIVRSMAERSV